METGTIADLGDGVLSTTITVLLLVAAGVNVFVESITLTNGTTSACTCNIYLNRNGTRRRISPRNLTMRVGYQVILDDGISLVPGDLIEGVAAANDAIEFTINGVVQTI